MSRTLLAGMLGLGLVACSSAAVREPEQRDAMRSQLGNRAVNRTLVVGTLIRATIHDSLSWRRNESADTLTATVSADVRNGHRWVVIPAGCRVGLRIAQRGPAANKRRADAGVLLDVTSVTVRGQMYPVRATVEWTPAVVRRASREVVVAPGTRILFVLPEGLTVERRLEDSGAGHATVFARLEIASSFDPRQIRAPAQNC
jgi:hypothetical protein